MAISNFLQEVWAAALLMELENESIWQSLGNRNYQADASNAKQVKIGRITNSITVSDYAADTNISAPEVLTDSNILLNLDQQKSFHFYVDDIHKVQTRPDLMSEAMRRTAIAVAQVKDTYISGLVSAAVTTANSETLAANYTYTQLINKLIDLKTKMMTKNVSQQRSPWIVMSPADYGRIEKYLLDKGTNTGTFLPVTSESTFRAGFTGSILGMRTYVSNNIPVGEAASPPEIFVGTSDAFTVADQITEVIAYRPELRFGDAVKGLYVYGALVTDPDQLFKITTAKD